MLAYLVCGGTLSIVGSKIALTYRQWHLTPVE